LSAKNRKTFGFISHPKIQFKYAILNSLFVSGVILLSNLLVVYRLRSYADSQSDIEMDTALLYNITDFTMQMGFLTFLISFFITFFSTIIITHRFVGPFISINRFVDSLITSKFDEQLVLRTTDEMHEIADKLKTLGERLKTSK
jgi:hypothetical protein